MRLESFAFFVLLFGTWVAGARTASGQNYPDKPIRLITAGAGGGVEAPDTLFDKGLDVVRER